MRFSLLVRNGDVVDPGGGNAGCLDIGICGDRIAAVDRAIPPEAAHRVIDATGLIVTPGLVDLHTHVYHGVGRVSVDPDRIAWRTGVTTWIDAGSAGANTYAGLSRYVIAGSSLRMRAFLNFSSIGLVARTAELANPLYCDVDACVRAALENAGEIVGIKARIDGDTVGPLGLEPLRMAAQAARRSGLPLMVHIAHGPPEVADVLGVLQEGDIVTHCLTGLSMKLVDDHGGPLPCFRAARDRGVLFDVGHGAGSFSFETAEAMVAAGHAPDAISSDIHSEAMLGSLRDLPTCMSKMLGVGMSLEDVVMAATAGPARAIGLDGVGTLAVGSSADVALFRHSRDPVTFWDAYHVPRSSDHELLNVLTIAAGRPLGAEMPEPLPSWLTLPAARAELDAQLAAEVRRATLPHATLPEGFGPPEPII